MNLYLFYEQYPLYRRYIVSIPSTLDGIEKPRINMHCGVCKSVRTFSMVNNYYDSFGYVNHPSNGASCFAKYVCVSCQEFTRDFAVRIADDLSWIQKIGQMPPWDVAGDARLEQLLGAHSSFYKKGLISESQGYGIGAFAYYRRIAEEVIDELLGQVANLIPANEREAYEEALAKVITTRVTSEKIDLVKDLLPPILRPEGMNPLAALHTSLSEGLHAESDERCLELAEAIRQILLFLVEQIAIASDSGRAFTESMRSLLDKKAAKTD